MNFFPNHQRRIDIIAEILTATRQTKHLTTKQLAFRLNRPESFVIAYESGECRLDLPELVDIADALGIDIIELFDLYQQRI